MCVCVCMSEHIYLLQSPPSLVQQGLIYAVAVAILWRMLKWHHSSALTPVCSLTLPLPADSSTPGMIYQALKQQTKAPRNVCRARDGLIDKHRDPRTKTQEGVNFIMSWDSAWLRSEQYGLSSSVRIKFMFLKYNHDQAIKFLLQVFVAV